MFQLMESQRLFVMPSIQMRNIDIRDAHAYYTLYTAPEVTQYLPDDMIPKSLNSAIEQMTNLFFRGRNIPYWAVVDQESDLLIGTCGFVNSDFHNKRLEIAYELHPQVWKKGIIHNSVKASLEYAFNKMDIKRVEAVTVIDNLQSQKVLEKAGFQLEGILRNYKLFRGKMIDVKMFAITEEDYKKLWKK